MRFSFQTGIRLSPFYWKREERLVSSFKEDIFAALSVALVAIPQAIAYAVLAGLPPISGLLSAIFGSFFIAAFASSKHLISGPTSAMAILVQTILMEVQRMYLFEPLSYGDTLIILSQIALIIGLVQVGAGFFNVAKVLQFVSSSVILGYLTGVSVAILVGQIYPLFGVPSQDQGIAIIFQLAHLCTNCTVDLLSLSWGLSALLFLWLFNRRGVPAAFVLIVVSGVITFLLGKAGIHLATLPSIESASNLIPPLVFPFWHLSLLLKVFPSAIAIAFLGIFEVFSVSRALSVRTGQAISVNQEMYGVGIGNFLLSFLGGAMPASASLSRSFTNILSGGKSHFSALFSSLFVGLLSLFFWPFFTYIPLVVLSAILIKTVLSMIDTDRILFCLKATRGDAVVFFLTLGASLFFRLDAAFFIGIVISIGFYLYRSAMPRLVEYAFNLKGRLVMLEPNDAKHKRVRIIGIGGELFFGVADLFQETLHTIAKDPYVRVIVLRLNGVYHVDASFCLALLRLAQYLQGTSRHIVITGITPEVWEVLQRCGLVDQVGIDNLFLTDELNPQFSTWKGCLRAKELVGGE